MIHTVKGFGVVNKAEVDVFWFFFLFFFLGTLAFSMIQQMMATSGSSSFSKFSLNIWKFMVLVLLKPEVENFEHYFASV